MKKLLPKLVLGKIFSKNKKYVSLKAIINVSTIFRIIDDPLEAFNRIMKEKEKKKDERRSPDRRRRSKDRHIRGNFRPSPYNNRIKDHGYHEKRGRSRDRDTDRRWSRYGKTIDKERDRERDRDRDRERDRDRDRDHDREKISGYRLRRSKSVDRSSR